MMMSLRLRIIPLCGPCIRLGRRLSLVLRVGSRRPLRRRQQPRRLQLPSRQLAQDRPERYSDNITQSRKALDYVDMSLSPRPLTC